LILKPSGTYRFKITGERDYGEIVLTINKEFHLEDARFDLKAMKYFNDYLPNKMYDTFVRVTRGVIRKKFAGEDVTIEDLINDLSKAFADYFLSFFYLTKMWPKAVVLEDLRILKENVDIFTKRVLLKRINEKFEGLLRAIKKVKILED